MSRLYNTLEKIRSATQGEAALAHPLPRLSAPAPRSRRSVLLMVAGCVVVLGGVALGLYLSKSTTKPLPARITPAPQQATRPGPAPTGAAATAPPPSPQQAINREEQYARLNNTGLTLLREGRHWHSIHAFEQARALIPDRPEAQINTAVALAELGLRVPAQRLLRQARALPLGMALLQQNLELLGRAGFLDDHPMDDTPGDLPAQPPADPAQPR